MIITQTPFRISFFGGGTDIPEFFNEYGGAVVSTTIDKYCYLNVRPLPQVFEYKSELVYSKMERVGKVDEIQHPAIREAMKYLGVDKLRLAYEGDLPARSGLGTSSSFAVGLIQALYTLQGKYADKRKLAEDAIHLERVLCGEKGGLQDQIAASFGGLNRINFSREGWTVNPVILNAGRKKMLKDNLMLFFTGFSRLSSEVQKETEAGIKEKTNTKQLREMLPLVDAAERILVSGTDLNEFGRMLDHAWNLKRSLAGNISNPAIDALYASARKAGALGGKLLGAGGGGFLLLYAEKERQEPVRQALSKLLYIPFDFERQGTRVLYYSPGE